jgi:hypothetical protein
MMLDNPLSQIERTKDAYAGNMQGLQKRANMTKELVDLLAMQQLKQDLDAIKRNQAMQQQGNPATIKEQMQQGLMGEYRQQAAKEMGIGPSEMDVVQRARQGMPQGMPQQQPRMAQGMMSQARPVQLAGGGIVAFQEGGPTKDELAKFLKAAAEKRRASEPSPSSIEQTPRQREMQELIARLAERRGNPLIDLSGTKTEIQERERSRALQEEMEEMFTPKTGGIQVGQMPRPEPIVDEGIASNLPPALNPNYVPPALSPRTPPGGGVLRPEDPTPTKPAPSIQDRLDAVRTSGIAAGIDPYQLDQTQREQAEADIAKDPDKAGLAAIDRIKRLSKMGENEKLLEDMQKRVQATYDETTPSRMDDLVDLFTAAGRGGITGVGVRGGQLRREEAARRKQLDQDVMGIQATTIELNRNYGADAAKAYADAESTIINQKNNARNFLANADQAEQASLMDRARLTLDEQQNVRQLYTEQERNRLLSEQITEGNLSSLSKSIDDSLALNATQVMAITEQVNEDPRYAEIRSLDPTDDDDARKLKLLEEARDAEIIALTADLTAMSDALRVRQLRIQSMQDDQVRRLTPREEVSLSPEAQKAMASAGG